MAGLSRSSRSPGQRIGAPIACALLALTTAVVGPVSAQEPVGTLDANNLGGTPNLGYQANVSNYFWQAQTFLAGRSGSILSAQVTMFFYTVGDHPTQPIGMDIRHVGADGFPSGPALASTSIPPSAVTSEGVIPGSLVTGVFDNPVAVTAGERYALVITTTDSYNMAISYDAAYDPYPDGQAAWLADPSGWYGGPWGWFGGPWDWIFAIYISDPVTYESLASLTYEWVSKAGIANELAAILESAAAAEARGNLNAVAGKLEEFRALLKAQAGKSITVENAQTLINYSYEL